MTKKEILNFDRDKKNKMKRGQNMKEYDVLLEQVQYMAYCDEIGVGYHLTKLYGNEVKWRVGDYELEEVKVPVFDRWNEFEVFPTITVKVCITVNDQEIIARVPLLQVDEEFVTTSWLWGDFYILRDNTVRTLSVYFGTLWKYTPQHAAIMKELQKNIAA